MAKRPGIVLTDGQYLCGGAEMGVDEEDLKEANRRYVPDAVESLGLGNHFKREKPEDPRSSASGALLGFSGSYGVGGIERITAHFLRSDAKGKVHDVVLSLLLRNSMNAKRSNI